MDEGAVNYLYLYALSSLMRSLTTTLVVLETVLLIFIGIGIYQYLFLDGPTSSVLSVVALLFLINTALILVRIVVTRLDR